MLDLPYILLLAIGGAFCGLAGLIGSSCAITKRGVIAAAFQGALFGTCFTMAVDWVLGTQFSGIAVAIGGLLATMRMALIIPICNIILKLLYDVLYAFIQRRNKD